MNKEYDDEIEIDLGALFQCLLKKWWLIVICALIGAGLALGSTILLITPKYQSSAMLYILNKTTMKPTYHSSFSYKNNEI